MKLLVLGTSGYHPTDTRQTACLMLPEIGVVLDAGTGIYRIRHHLISPSIDVFLTHAHLDHCLGLTFFFDILYQQQIEAVRVHGAAEKLAEIKRHLFAPALFPVLPPLTFVELAPQVLLPGGGKLTHFPLVHPGGSIGYRLDWPDRSLAYVTDTTAALDAPYVEQIAGVDLLIHECNFKDGFEKEALLTGHSCSTPVAMVAKAAKVKRLILVHFNSINDDPDPVGLAGMQAIFPHTELGRDGLELHF